MDESEVLRGLPQRVSGARERIRRLVRQTPCEPSLALAERAGGGAEVLLKLENLQHTGSFKARGATNKVLCLTPGERARGVVAASSGNHGAALAWACQATGVRALIYVPTTASLVKVGMIRRYGADVRLFGTDGLDTELHAREVAAREGMTYVSPYNDIDVMAGQGSVGVEVGEQVGEGGGHLDAIYVAVGGGGLIGGVAAYLKHATPGVQVIGALPRNSPVMAESVRAGTVVEMESLPTLSDGTAGGIERDSITFPVCQALVDDWILVTEDEIADAMRRFVEEEHMLLEGSAGVALAAFERRASQHRGERVCVVICGANISAAILSLALGHEK